MPTPADKEAEQMGGVGVGEPPPSESPQQESSAAGWKPDFTSANPYEGAPPEYIKEVGETFVPTAENPVNPIEAAAAAGQATPEQAAQAAEAAAQAQEASGFQPDFTSDSPYSGAPASYAAAVAKVYVPTQSLPLNPVQVAVVKGEAQHLADHPDVVNLTQKQQDILGVTTIKQIKPETVQAIVSGTFKPYGADEKPDFTKVNPFEGLSKGYLQAEIAGFKPTASNPVPPVVAFLTANPNALLTVPQSLTPQSFTNDEIDVYHVSKPEEQFKILVGKGFIPEGSQFKGVDDKGQVLFLNPEAVLRNQIARLWLEREVEVTAERAKEIADQQQLAMHNIQSVNGFQGRLPSDFTQQDVDSLIKAGVKPQDLVNAGAKFEFVQSSIDALNKKAENYQSAVKDFQSKAPNLISVSDAGVSIKDVQGARKAGVSDATLLQLGVSNKELSALDRLSSTDGDIIKYLAYNQGNSQAVQTLIDAGYTMTPQLRAVIKLAQTGNVMQLEPIKKYDENGKLIPSEGKYAIDPYKVLASDRSNLTDISSPSLRLLLAAGYSPEQVQSIQKELSSMPDASRVLVSQYGISGLKEAVKTGDVPYNWLQNIDPKASAYERSKEFADQQYMENLNTLTSNMGAKVQNWVESSGRSNSVIGTSLEGGAGGVAAEVAGAVGFPLLISKSILNPASTGSSALGVVKGILQSGVEAGKGAVGKSTLTPYQLGGASANTVQMLAPWFMGKGGLSRLPKPSLSAEAIGNAIGNAKNALTPEAAKFYLQKSAISLTNLGEIIASPRISNLVVDATMKGAKDTVGALKNLPEASADAMKVGLVNLDSALTNLGEVIASPRVSNLVVDSAVKGAQAAVDNLKALPEAATQAAQTGLSKVGASLATLGEVVASPRISNAVADTLIKGVTDTAGAVKSLVPSGEAMQGGLRKLGDALTNLGEVIASPRVSDAVVNTAIESAKAALAEVRALPEASNAVIKAGLDKAQTTLTNLGEAVASPRISNAVMDAVENIYKERVVSYLEDVKDAIQKKDADIIRARANELERLGEQLDYKLAKRASNLVAQVRVGMTPAEFENAMAVFREALEASKVTFSELERLAQEAGRAHDAMLKARESMNATDITDKNYRYRAGLAQEAVNDSKLADADFINKYRLLTNVDSEGVGALESKSGMVGLERVTSELTDVWQAYQKALKDAGGDTALIGAVKQGLTGKLNPFGTEPEQVQAVLDGQKPLAEVNIVNRLAKVPDNIIEEHYARWVDMPGGKVYLDDYIYYPKESLGLVSEFKRIDALPWEERWTPETHTQLGRLLGYSEGDIQAFLDAMAKEGALRPSVPEELRARIEDLKPKVEEAYNRFVKMVNDPRGTDWKPTGEAPRKTSSEPLDIDKLLDEIAKSKGEDLDDLFNRPSSEEPTPERGGGVGVQEKVETKPADADIATEEKALPKEGEVKTEEAAPETKPKEETESQPDSGALPKESEVPAPKEETGEFLEFFPKPKTKESGEPVGETVVKGKFLPDFEPASTEVPFIFPSVEPAPSPNPEAEPTTQPAPEITPQPEPKPGQVPKPEIAPTPNLTPEPEPTPAPAPAPSPTPTPTPSPEPSPLPTPTPTPEPTPVPPPEKVIVPQLPSEGTDAGEIFKNGVPKGTVEYRMGKKWVAVPPPYEVQYYLDNPLPGTYKFSSGKGSAKKTLQVLNGLPPEDIDLDMGWAKVHIASQGGTLTMDFGGGAEAADTRWTEEAKQDSEIEAKVQAYRDTLTAEEKDSLEGTPENSTEKIPGSKRQKPQVKWVDSAADLPRDEETVGASAPTESIRGYYDGKGTIYAIKGVTTPSELAHEEYHALKGHTETSDPRQFTREELEADKYAYEQTGELPDHIDTLRAVFNDLTAYSYKVKPRIALEMIQEEMDKVDPPESWREELAALEEEVQGVAESSAEKTPQQRGLGKVLLPEYSTDNLKVYGVNMAYIRNKYANQSVGDRLGVDVVLGGHSYVYDKIIPLDEVWVDSSLQGNDLKGVVAHELEEREKMSKGMEYSEAHNDYANKVEIEGRLNPDELDRLIEERLKPYDKPPHKVYNKRKKQTDEPESLPARYYHGRRLRGGSLGVGI